MWELYSDRMRKLNEEEPEVYKYDGLTPEFRVQLYRIIEDVADPLTDSGRLRIWDYIHDLFAREVGKKTLGPLEEDYCYNYGKKNIERYIDDSSDERLLDLIDFAFHFFDMELRDIATENFKAYEHDIDSLIDHAINELNHRFRQHNLGYEFANGELIRIDNKVIHDKIIKPALRLICEEGFDGAEEEFRNAFEKLRINDNKGAIAEASKAFESTMKTICDRMNYGYDKDKDTSRKLIQILEKNNFYPNYMTNHLTNLIATLESGIPTVRNKNAGHGQGSTVVNVPDELTEYAINLTATNIVMLVGIYRSAKGLSKVTQQNLGG